MPWFDRFGRGTQDKLELSIKGLYELEMLELVK
jgi:hypothetical protein